MRTIESDEDGAYFTEDTGHYVAVHVDPSCPERHIVVGIRQEQELSNNIQMEGMPAGCIYLDKERKEDQKESLPALIPCMKCGSFDSVKEVGLSYRCERCHYPPNLFWQYDSEKKAREEWNRANGLVVRGTIHVEQEEDF